MGVSSRERYIREESLSEQDLDRVRCESERPGFVRRQPRREK